MQVYIKYLNNKENQKYQPIIYFGDVEDEFFNVVSKAVDKPLAFIYFKDVDWDKDFTPWPYDKFAGEGDTTISLALEKFKENKEMLNDDLTAMGYSLGGLMSMYSLSKVADIKKCASVSGSLWYPNLLEYLNKKTITDKKIYLSLGDKEAKTKHQLMKTVEDKTSLVKQFLEKDNEVLFEYNQGNHFYQVQERLLKAIKYLTK